MNYTKRTILLGATVAGLCATAHAIPTLTIDDGVNTPIVISDNGAGDLFSSDGWVTWGGTIGDWILNVDTGVTKPAVGSVTQPVMDLHFIAQSAAAGTLTLTFSEDGFDSTGGIRDLIGGTTSGLVWDNVYKGTELLVASGPLGSGAFSDTSYGSVSLAPSDIFSVQVIIQHDGAGLTSGDKEVSVPDGGTTVMLLGGALSIFGLVRKKLAA